MSKRQEIREKRRRQQQRQRLLIIGLVAIGAVLIAAALILPSIKPVGPIATANPNARPMAKDNAMGDPNAPVTITEYSDFQCPYCARFWTEMEQQIIDNYVATGKVYFVYRSMGNMLSDNINRQAGGNNTESRDAAEAAYCAGDQNKFWEYHDILFANQTGEGVGDYTQKRLIAFADTLGLNTAEFKSCLTGGKYRDRVLQDEKDGNAAGIRATPSFVINGKVLEGAQPFSAFQQAIEAALAGK